MTTILFMVLLWGFITPCPKAWLDHAEGLKLKETGKVLTTSHLPFSFLPSLQKHVIEPGSPLPPRWVTGAVAPLLVIPKGPSLSFLLFK